MLSKYHAPTEVENWAAALPSLKIASLPKLENVVGCKRRPRKQP
jgi:hypothetical protein